jgi:hypothetical protein
MYYYSPSPITVSSCAIHSLPIKMRQSQNIEETLKNITGARDVQRGTYLAEARALPLRGLCPSLFLCGQNYPPRSTGKTSYIRTPPKQAIRITASLRGVYTL